MDLDTYLKAKGESASAFARRAGLPASTVIAIRALGSHPRVDIAQALVRASEDEPTPDGGTITYDDFVREPGGEAA